MSTVKATNFQHASAANPAIVLAADGSATANVSAINGGPLAGFRNAIINGNFDHWQRGTSHSTSGYGSADRWSLNVSGTASFARQAFDLGQSSVPNNPTYFARYNVTVAPVAASNVNLRQFIEGVQTLAGQQVTVSFWAKADAAKTIWVGHFQSFGTAGSPSATVNTAGQVVTLSTSWARYSVTTTLPSVSGKTLGTDGNDYLSVHFIISNNTTGQAWSAIPAQTITFDIAQVQIEAGPVATPFERRPIGTELALCQRYYETADISNMGAALRLAPPASTAFAAANSHAIYTYKVTKRETPSIGNILWSNASSQVVSPGISSVRFLATATGAAFIDPGFTIDAEL